MIELLPWGSTADESLIPEARVDDLDLDDDTDAATWDARMDALAERRIRQARERLEQMGVIDPDGRLVSRELRRNRLSPAVAASKPARPVMIVVAGPPGSGKSTFFPIAAMGVDSFSIDDRCAQVVSSGPKGFPKRPEAHVRTSRRRTSRRWWRSAKAMRARRCVTSRTRSIFSSTTGSRARSKQRLSPDAPADEVGRRAIRRV
jgi:hypothetical protein